MSSSKRVFDLQQVELAIQSKKKQLEEINMAINYNEAYELAKTKFESARNEQREREKQYKDLDAEAEELRTSIKQINDKLYGGKIKNPKELVGYEQEAGILKGSLAKKDDTLLDLMEKIDAAKSEINRLQQDFAAAETAWKQLKSTLQGQADQAGRELAELEKRRLEMLESIDKDTLAIYDGIKSRKGQAVVKVEQGRCLGCRVILSVSELQRVRGQGIVLCSNCGRILYLS